jgi:hypothetical protein
MLVLFKSDGSIDLWFAVDFCEAEREQSGEKPGKHAAH